MTTPSEAWPTPPPTLISTRSSSMPSATSPLKSQDPTRSSRGPGRPATARRIWQDPSMNRRLVRLYLYTAETSLNTRQISNLLTELAQDAEKCERSDKRQSLPSSQTRSKTQSKIRSTQKELRELLSDGYHVLRPCSREAARARIAEFRLIRDRRIEKSRKRRKPGRRLNSATHPEVSQSKLPQLTQAEIQASGFFDVEIAPQRSSVSSFSSWASTDSTKPNAGGRGNQKHVRLSWLRERLVSSSKERPSSSVIMDIRSLISLNSLRSSLFSRNSSLASLASPPATPDFPFFDDQSFARRNKLIIKFCCQNRPDCLHREAALLCSSTQPEALLGEVALKERSIKDGRDIWNMTILHLLAQWGKDTSVVSLLALIVHYCEPSMVSARNIDGDTFLHILGRRWYGLAEVPNSGTLADLVTLVSSTEFHFDSCNIRGQNVLASFIPKTLVTRKANSARMDLHLHRRVVHALHSLLQVKDGGRFLLESLRTISSDSQGDVLAAFLWSPALLTESRADEFLLSTETQQGFEYWRGLAASGVFYNPIPSLHTYLQHQTIISADLLDQGADPNEYNKEGQTCLMVLLEKAHHLRLSESTMARLVQMLLDHGANLKLLDQDGNTALHYAVQARLPNIAQQLISAGADMDARNILDKTAAHIAVRQYALARPGGGGGTPYALAQTMLIRFFDAKIRNRRSLPRIPE